MPAVSSAQRGFAGMSKTAAGRAKLRAHGKTPMPKDVADEYARTKGKLPERAAKK